MAGPDCLLCLTGDLDTAEHTLADCDFFAYERIRLQETIGGVDASEEVKAAMLECREHWEAVAEFAGHVMSAKSDVERRRRRDANARGMKIGGGVEQLDTREEQLGARSSRASKRS